MTPDGLISKGDHVVINGGPPFDTNTSLIHLVVRGETLRDCGSTACGLEVAHLNGEYVPFEYSDSVVEAPVSCMRCITRV